MRGLLVLHGVNKPQPASTYRLTNHAAEQMLERDVTEAQVAHVLAAPEQNQQSRAGNAVGIDILATS